MPSSFTIDTPLDELSIVSIDLETTGLHVANDRIVQVAIVKVSATHGISTLTDFLVNPGIPIPERSTDIHGISESDVRYAPDYAGCQDHIRQLLNDNVVIGHHIGFDLAVLRHEFARLKRAWKPPPSLDVALLAAALFPKLADHSMERVTDYLDISVTNRHTALGDSQAAAAIFCKLLPLLAAQGINTFGEAKALESSSENLITQEQRAGWFRDSSLAPRPKNSEHHEQVRQLREIKLDQPERAREALANDVPAIDILADITANNIKLHQQALQLCLQEFIALDLGEPPVAFDAIILGSGARGESGLFPDQDNVFLLDDQADIEFLENDDWFEKLAVRMIDTLADIGFHRCPGWVMASNPRWRKSFSQFEKQTTHWISQARGEALHYCNIILDNRHFYGNGLLTSKLRESISAQTRSSRFLHRLYNIHKNHTGALGWFGRIITDPNAGPNHGKIDLKTGGTMPLVTAVRILSLYHDVHGFSTRERISKLGELGVVNNADELLESFSHIVFLLLRQQLADHQNGTTISNYLPPQAMSSDERKHLVDALRTLRRFCKQVEKAVQKPIE
ncbi:MAG: putative nucleotidyltransferase substrate binding domain-containing protein [Pseudomonadota bacterium]